MGKIIQIAAVHTPSNGSYAPATDVVALTDDGRVFVIDLIYIGAGENRWLELPPLPQNEEPPNG